MQDKRTGEVYTNLWFGNFYEPAYSDRNFVKQAIALVRKLGFNSVMLDTKNQQDFADRFAGNDASPYVSMIEDMQKLLKETGMSHEFLALYLNGDNLYPEIRFSPPIYGESVVNPDGTDGKWYRYWSDKAKDAQEEHVRGLLLNYRDNRTEVETAKEDRIPICSMWDPIVAPSFDKEGRKRYLSWLKKNYHDRIEDLNSAYCSEYTSFEELQKEDYWYSCRYPGELTFSREDFKYHPEKIALACDNNKWRRAELVEYFTKMQVRLHNIDDRLLTIPNLTQWGYFLNVDGSLLSDVGMADLWDTAVRGIDLYELASYVDMAHFIAVPVTPAGDPDPYVVSLSHAMMRSMNPGREWIGGIYFGRYLYNDLYQVLTPEEIIGSMTASGMSGYTAYGMCGMDDGGVLQRMDETFLTSLANANRWMQQTLPKLGSRLPAPIAILFPTAMASFETMRTDGNKERRLDLLGWYKMCLDLGYDCDVVGRDLFHGGVPEQYRVVILAADDSYDYDKDPLLEQALEAFVAGGGVLLHGPEPDALSAHFGIMMQEHRAMPVRGTGECKDAIMVSGPKTCSIAQEDKEREFYMLGYYLGLPGERIRAEAAVACSGYGEGYVFSFGFFYGYSYITKVIPHVPREQKNREMYPLSLSHQSWLSDILSLSGLTPHPGAAKNVETALFENGELFVSHSSYPVSLPDGSMLAPRTARFIEKIKNQGMPDLFSMAGKEKTE